MLWPKTKAWTFRSDSEVLIERYYQTELTLEASHIKLARFMEQWQQENAKKLEPLWQAVEVAIAFLGLEVLFWLLDMALYV